MKALFVFTGFIALVLIFWSILARIMGIESFSYIFPLCLVSIGVFFITGFLKNMVEKKRFEDFLRQQRENKDVQRKIENREIDPGDKYGRAKVKATYRPRKAGLNWTGGSVHGAVPKRTDRKEFLSGNR